MRKRNSNNKSKWIITAIIIVIVEIIAAVLIHFLSPKFCSEISADGILGYIGTCVSTLGSLFVGVVAILQSNKANEIAENAQEFDSWHFKMDIRPFIIVSDIKCETMSINNVLMKNEKPIYIFDEDAEIDHSSDVQKKDCEVIWMYVANTTDSLVTIQFDEMTDNYQNNYKLHMMNNVKKKTIIKGQSTGVIGFYSSDKFWKKQSSSLSKYSFILENRFGERYKESFYLNIVYEMRTESNDGTYRPLFTAQDYNCVKFQDGNIN